ncbi:MAG: hypothetical protein EP341_09620 [Sphingomonadales bacterium]|nr:MAG: hypothetical protein EP341_09620 [Sphingomonadales bacterium]
MTDRNELIEQCPRCGGYGFGCYECTPSDDIEAEQCAVVVEPLKWHSEEFKGNRPSVRNLMDLVDYEIVFRDNVWFSLSFHGEFETLESAKAAAQADYEQRILSTITIRPASEVAAEARAEAIEAAKAEIKPYRHVTTSVPFSMSLHDIENSIDALHTPNTLAALERMKGGE